MDTQQKKYEQGTFKLKDIPKHLRRYFVPKPLFPFQDIARELYRVMKKGGVVVWVVGDQTVNGSESGTSFKQALFFKEVGFNLHDTMIYMKNGSSYPTTDKYYSCFEYMFVLSKEKPAKVNLLRDRKNKWNGSWGKRSSRGKDGDLKIKERILCQENGIRFNVWKINTGYGFTTKDKISYNHPAIFPEQLAGDHIKSWSSVNDIVYDPFMGSGTTAKMAIILQRKYIGSEISSEYCQLAEKRIQNEKRQERFHLAV